MSQSDSPLPGEFDEETKRAALMQGALAMFAETVDAVPDDYLAQLLALYHEEWERRHSETWVIAE